MTTYAIPVNPVHDHDVEDDARPVHRVADPATDRRTAPGHTAELSAPEEVYGYLIGAEAARHRQLDDLPTVDLDPVAAAYRASVERILAEVRTALRRADAGLYGVCSGCGAAIPPERLELRPWATACARCASNQRH